MALLRSDAKVPWVAGNASAIYKTIDIDVVSMGPMGDFDMSQSKFSRLYLVGIIPGW